LFKGRWNTLKIDINNKSLYKLIKEEFSSKVPTSSKDRKFNKFPPLKLVKFTKLLSQIRYSLVVILELNSVSGIQYKDMMIDR